MGVVDQSWVTVALNDANAEKAIVLAKSLRNSATTRRLSVIFSRNVSQKMKDCLLRTYDQCILLEKSHELNGISEELYAKILLWNLPFLKKCIFLHPDVLVLKNSDELFGIDGISAPSDFVDGVDASVLIVEPSFSGHEKLMEWMKQGKHEAEGDVLKRYAKWMKMQASFTSLPEKYQVTLTPGGEPAALTESAVSILRFRKSHPMNLKNGQANNGGRVGIFERAVYGFYAKLYHDAFDNQAMLSEPEPLPTVSRKLLDNGQEPIAVIGMSCRFPMADNVDEYWDLLVNGKDCIRPVPDGRWPSAMSEEYRGIQAGFLKCPVDEFDGKFFNISPMELTHMDPQQRLLLEVTWEALEDAGINPQTLHGTQTAVYLGTWLQDYRELIRNSQGEFADFHRTYLGNSLGGSGGRLSFFLGLTGPNIATESGCSSGMAALVLSCEALRKGRCDTALASGANLLLYPFQKKHMINVVSPDGRCKTFDEKADGFGRAEGVATLVLKRYSDALKSGDNIVGLIRGCGLSQEGTSRSLGTPTKDVQEIAMREALYDAGISPVDVSFVEAHGTGTPVGDPIELAAISSIYCKNLERERPLFVASGKTMIGHTESCSGLAGIIKVILSMKNEKIPPHIHLENLNPYIRLDGLPLEIPTKAVDWESVPGKPRFAGISSFGITGTDSHVIVQEAPTYNPPKLLMDIQERPLHLLTFSGKSETALTDVLNSFSSFLETNQDINLADAAYTLNAGRAHFMHRVGVMASNVPDLMKKLKSVGKAALMPEAQPKLCFLFTGQGSQNMGMGKTLYETNAVFKMHFDQCDALLQDRFQISIKPVIWGQVENEALHKTLYSQTSIFCIEYCLMKLWESWGIKPDAVIGHSLGEFAATVCAGILSLEDALTLVAERSRLVETICKSGKMIVIKADQKTVDGHLNDFMHNNKNFWLDYAALNSSDQTVLAGPPQVVDAFAMYCTKLDLKAHILDATNAFHSRDMDDIIGEYSKVIRNVKPRAAPSSECTYFSGLKGVACQAEDINCEYWIQHSRDRVRFTAACKAAYEDGCRIFVEVGPQPVLCALTMKNISGESMYEEPITVLPSMRKKENEWNTLLGTLTKMYQLGYPIDWNGFEQYYNRRKIKLPTYPFNRKKHWYETKNNKNSLTVMGKSLHPLLGCQIPNATTSSIFQSTIEVDKLPYLKDHAIGGQVVFPAAGFLEVALKSGNLSTIGEINADEDLMNPISIEKLMIEAPLGLYENEPCQLQTVVQKMDSAENKVSIYTQQRNSSDDEGSGMGTVKWIRQASGTFVPLQMNVTLQENESMMDSLDNIRERCAQEVDIHEFYDKLKTVGLEFGTTFRSLGKVWKNSVGDKKEILTEVVYPTGGSSATELYNSNKHYICHPVVLDALIQTIILGNIEGVKDSLFVPVLIDKMIVLSKADFGTAADGTPTTPELFAHCKWEANQAEETRSVVLYTSTGKVLAIMSGAHLIKTTTEVILKTLSNQQLVVPDMYEEIWAPKSGPYKNRAILGGLAQIFNEAPSQEILDQNLLNERERESANRRDKLVYLHILKTFYQLGWNPTEMKGKTFTVGSIIEQLGIIKSYTLLVHRFFRILEEEGVLALVQCSPEEYPHAEYEMIKLPPFAGDVDKIVEEIALESAKEETVDFQVVQGCCENLKNILSGKCSALSVLFPEEKGSSVSAETFYNNSCMVPKFNSTIHHVFHQLIQKHASLPEEERGILRVLEVGAGTGSSTKVVLPIFEKFGTRFQYTYTDISPVFFSKAGEMFQGYGKKMKYKVLNIEEDPLNQGFIPQQYDIIFASNVLHATKSLSESVRHARMLLRDDGYMVLAETMKEIRDFDVVFGLLDAYWRFTDFENRKWYPNVSAQTWMKVYKEEGFEPVKEHLCYDGRLGLIVGKAATHYNFNTIATAAKKTEESKSKWWLVFSSEERFRKYYKQRMERFGRKILLVSMPAGNSKGSFVERSRDHFEVRPEEKEDLMKVFRNIKERDLNIEGILYLWGFEPEKDILRRTHGFLFLSQILLSDFKGLPRLIVPTEGIMRIDDESATDSSPATLCGMAKTLRTEHFNLHVKCIDLDPDEIDENVKYDELLTELWNDDNEFQIAYRQRNRHVARLIACKDFASPLPLPKCDRFSILLPKVTKNIADLKFCPNGKSPLKENEIEVKIRAYGLNFRDIFTVLKPNEEFEKWNTMGLEFSGTVVSIGEKVQKWKTGDYVIGCNFAGGALPSHLCMEEDMVFAMPDQVTFCEAATIPAAFATVYYCLVMIADLKRGETVLIHAGSGGVGLFAIQVAKALGANIICTAGSRRKRAFLRNLGVSHVFHSRNTEFGKQIMEVTNGQGVHVVLNSLTSPGFKEASLSCSTKGARFVEMSRLHIWTEEEVKALRPDVKYSAVDLTKVDRSIWQTIWVAVDEYMDKGHINAIPFIQYDATCIREALTYMQKAKHIGKIIVTMPDMIQKENDLIPRNYLFSDRATYLVTGGLGGIGMELAKWMCQLGAKHLVLTSRSKPDERAMKIIDDFNSKGYNLVPLCLDIGDYQQCKKLLNDDIPALGLPRLRGIFHLAGLLRDATLTNQTIEMYSTSFQGKVRGIMNLHELTKDSPLEFFNMFSSMVSVFGPIGQSNYAAANNYLDALAHHRHAIGLCGQSVNWGQWGEVGLSKDIKVPAMRPFSPSQGLSALEIIMRSQKGQVCVFDVDFTVVRKLTANIGSYLEELKIAKETQSVAFDVKINNFWDDFNGAEDAKRKQDVIKSYVCQILRQILKLDEDEIIDENQKFSEMGMDSLMMLEMKNFIQTMLGKNITMNVSELAELTSVNKLASHLMGLIKQAKGEGEIDGKQIEEEDDGYSFSPSQKELLDQDMVLPDHVKAKDDVRPLCKRSDIKTVLLTGCTGKLGPYMLEALASRPLEKIFCLIRAKDDSAAHARLIRVLQDKNLAASVDMSKIECVAGDITEANLSLPQERYNELANLVDAVVHVAVKGNLTEPYRKNEEGIRNDLRSVNVIGTINVLEFSAAGKTKHVLHTSTLLTCHKVGSNGLLLEDFCQPEDIYDTPNIGYPISKFVCERLAAQAIQRGIPVHVHRFPGLSGDKNGCFTFPNNHAMLRLLGFCKLGVMPANPVPLQLLAVDNAAELSAQLFFNDTAQPDVYNVTNPHTCVLQSFPELARDFGFQIDVVEYEEFFDKLQKNDEYASLFPYRKRDIDDGKFVEFTTSTVVLQSWINNPERFFYSEKLKVHLKNYEETEQPMDILRRDMQFANDTNIFKRYGLQQNI